jgi:integrase
MSVRKRAWKTRHGEAREAWIVDYVDRQGERHIETFDRKKEAEARQAEVRVDVRKGIHVAHSKSITIAEAAELWIEARKLDGLERSTLRQYRSHIKHHIVPALGRMKLSDLTTSEVTAFTDALRKAGVSKATTGKIRASLGSLVSEAQRRGKVARNVVFDLGRTRTKGETRHKRKLEIGKDIPAPAEVSAILAHANGRWRPLLLVAAFTGLRSSELRGLRWSDVELKASKLHVRQRADQFHEIGSPKSKAGHREVPFGPVVLNTLKDWKLRCPKGELDLVFPNTKGKIESHPNIIARAFIPTVIAAGLVDDKGEAKYTGLHVMRHFYASWCINRKQPPKVIQTRLGHSTIAMTLDTYGHLFPDVDDADEIAEAEAALVSA